MATALTAAALVLAAGPIGCSQPSGRSDRLDPRSPSDPLAWPFWPSGIRIHPLSRIVQGPSDAPAVLLGASDPGAGAGPGAADDDDATPPIVGPEANPDGADLADWSIEARIEFTDPLGDPVKGYGRIELGLFDEVPGEPRRALGAWEVDLAQLQANARHFDVVVRTYRFKLDVEPGILGRSPVLYVRYEGRDGASLFDRLPLRTDP